MATILLTVLVDRADADATLEVGARLGCGARVIGDPDRAEPIVLLESLVVEDDKRAAEALRANVERTLDGEGIGHRVLGCVVTDSGMTTSVFTVRPLRAEGASEPLTIRANDRAEFESRLSALRLLFHGEAWPGPGLDGYEVTVEGLAAGDPDVQEPPFVPKH